MNTEQAMGAQVEISNVAGEIESGLEQSADMLALLLWIGDARAALQRVESCAKTCPEVQRAFHASCVALDAVDFGEQEAAGLDLMTRSIRSQVVGAHRAAQTLQVRNA